MKTRHDKRAVPPKEPRVEVVRLQWSETAVAPRCAEGLGLTHNLALIESNYERPLLMRALVHQRSGQGSSLLYE